METEETHWQVDGYDGMMALWIEREEWHIDG